MTLIAYTNSEGTRRCDEKCYDAEGGVCVCICGGRNHGVGRRRAVERTAMMAGQILADLREQGNRGAVEISKIVFEGQGELDFGDEELCG